MTNPIEVGKYLGREFHWRNYNCWDFIRDVWLDHCGVDLGRRTPDSITTQDFLKAFSGQEFDVHNRIVHQIAQPEEPCLVYMSRPNSLSHVGVWVQGRLLHLRPRGNVVHEDFELASIGFPEIRFYK